MTLRIGFVGCGHIASVHSLAIGALGGAGIVDARVVAAYDTDTERARRLAGSHDAITTDEVESLLDACEVVWVCTWTSEHLPVVRAAVERGRSVFCEKPLAPSLAECEEVAALLQQVPHQVGLVLRHAPVFRALAEAVHSGRFGRALATVFRDDQYFPNQGMYHSDWRADPSLAGGGTLIEHSIHDVDVLRWVLGDPAQVSARVANQFGHAGIDDVAALTFAYPDASVATLISVWHQVMRRPSSRRVEVFCEDALLWTDDDHLGPLHVETTDAISEIEASLPAWVGDLELAPEITGLVAPYAVAAKAFLDALATGASGEPEAATALAAHRLVDVAYRSAAAGGAPFPAPAR
ncbi:MAG: Gfo/Idh/MocA family oxidoreductase [Acidimicrobiia bacterium]|nr:Gfo/Idh/MocA family oxidoreductase [Acidimicrobiia bacterium]